MLAAFINPDGARWWAVRRQADGVLTETSSPTPFRVRPPLRHFAMGLCRRLNRDIPADGEWAVGWLSEGQALALLWSQSDGAIGIVGTVGLPPPRMDDAIAAADAMIRTWAVCSLYDQSGIKPGPQS